MHFVQCIRIRFRKRMVHMCAYLALRNGADDGVFRDAAQPVELSNKEKSRPESLCLRKILSFIPLATQDKNALDPLSPSPYSAIVIKWTTLT